MFLSAFDASAGDRREALIDFLLERYKDVYTRPFDMDTYTKVPLKAEYDEFYEALINAESHLYSAPIIRYSLTYTCNALKDYSGVLLKDMELENLKADLVLNTNPVSDFFITNLYEFCISNYEDCSLAEFMYLLYVNRLNTRFMLLGMHASKFIIAENFYGTKYGITPKNYENYMCLMESGLCTYTPSIKKHKNIIWGVDNPLEIHTEYLPNYNGETETLQGYTFSAMIKNRIKLLSPLLKDDFTIQLPVRYSALVFHKLFTEAMEAVKDMGERLDLNNYREILHEYMGVLLTLIYRCHLVAQQIGGIDDMQPILAEPSTSEGLSMFYALLPSSAYYNAGLRDILLISDISNCEIERIRDDNFTYAFVKDTIDNCTFDAFAECYYVIGTEKAEENVTESCLHMYTRAIVERTERIKQKFKYMKESICVG